MVQAQLCKVCGHRHWLAEDHIFTDKTKPEPMKAEEPAAVVQTATAKPAFDRKTYQREYMREYMRKRRAKQ